MATTLQILQQAVADLQSNLKAQQDKLTALKTDQYFINLEAILNVPNVKAYPDGWVDGSGTFWRGEDARQNHESAQHQVDQHNQEIADTEAAVKTLQDQLDAKVKQLAQYEATSPVAQQEAKNNAAKGKTTRIVVITLLALAVVVTVVIIVRTKKKNKKSTSTPATT